MSSAKRRTMAWKRALPLCATALLGGAVVLTLTGNALTLYRLSSGRPVPGPAQPARATKALDVALLANAHLFGQSALANMPAITMAGGIGSNEYVLTGTVALVSASDGYAMIGRRSETTQLYRAGTYLRGASDTRLYQVFADHVVLEVAGALEVLKLPSTKLLGTSGKSRARVLASDVESSTESASSGLETPRQLVSAAQTLLADLQAEQNNVGGHAAGMLLHPSRAYQRRYGVREGDVLTAVNGVAVTDADSLDSMLRNTNARSLTLTYLRDGDQRTVGLTMPN